MFGLPRILLVYAIAVPLALVLGYSSGNFDPYAPDRGTLAIVALVLFVLVLPFLLQWSRQFMILTWNAGIIVFFLPGQPAVWMVMAVFTVMLLVIQKGINSTFKPLNVPFVTWPIVVLGLVMVVTAEARGGFGAHSLGSSQLGARKYGSLLAAILGYFALSSQAIPRKRARLYASLFFLSGITAGLSELINVAGSSLGWLSFLFGSGTVGAQNGVDSLMLTGMQRIEGLAWVSEAFCCFMLIRYGIKGILDVRHPWRIIATMVGFILGLFGGFRSELIFVAAVFLIQFMVEGLWRTWVILPAIGITTLGIVIVAGYSDQLPDAVQRTVSFLPVKVDPSVAEDAEYSENWRFDMWREVAEEVPKYFWLGRGYGYSEEELYLTAQMAGMGMRPSYATYITTSDFHSGPLTVIVPFGVFGCVAFLWFLLAGGRAVWCNFRNGDPELRLVNMTLLAIYTAKILFFLTIYGALDIDLAFFMGVIGLSIALNHGVCRRKARILAPRESKPMAVTALQPA